MLKLGLPIVYRPRVPYGRQNELFGFVTRIVDAEKGTIDLVTFPSHSETFHQSSVAKRSETVHIHCWEPVVDDEKEMLRKQVDDLTMRLNALEKRSAKKGESV